MQSTMPFGNITITTKRERNTFEVAIDGTGPDYDRNDFARAKQYCAEIFSGELNSFSSLLVTINGDAFFHHAPHDDISTLFALPEVIKSFTFDITTEGSDNGYLDVFLPGLNLLLGNQCLTDLEIRCSFLSCENEQQLLQELALSLSKLPPNIRSLVLTDRCLGNINSEQTQLILSALSKTAIHKIYLPENLFFPNKASYLIPDRVIEELQVLSRFKCLEQCILPIVPSSHLMVREFKWKSHSMDLSPLINLGKMLAQFSLQYNIRFILLEEIDSVCYTEYLKQRKISLSCCYSFLAGRHERCGKSSLVGQLPLDSVIKDIVKFSLQ